jgi:hypothetical protein
MLELDTSIQGSDCSSLIGPARFASEKASALLGGNWNVSYPIEISRTPSIHSHCIRLNQAQCLL